MKKVGANANKQRIEDSQETSNNTTVEPTPDVAEESPVAAAAASTQLSQSHNAAPDAGDDGDDEDYKPPTGKAAKKKRNAKQVNQASDDASLEFDLKKLKQRRINVAGAPKMPLNGYVRYMNERRGKLRNEQPQRTSLEHTKIIGEEWNKMSDELKSPYLEAAAKDKAKYHEELQTFFKENPGLVAKELAKAKKTTTSPNMENKASHGQKEKPASGSTNSTKNTKNTKSVEKKRQRPPSPDPDDLPLAQIKRTPTPQPSTNVPRTFTAGEIPIYTNEFLEHNRSLEMELRTLRKTKTDLEQQNAVLEQHVENTKAGHAKVMSEVADLKEENVRLEAYIKSLRQKLVGTLGGITMPPLEPSGLSVDNIDKYIQHFANMTSSSPISGQNNSMLSKVRDALRKMDTTDLQKP